MEVVGAGFVAVLNNDHIKWYFGGLVVLVVAILAAIMGASCVYYLANGKNEKVFAQALPISTPLANVMPGCRAVCECR